MSGEIRQFARGQSLTLADLNGWRSDVMGLFNNVGAEQIKELPVEAVPDLLDRRGDQLEGAVSFVKEGSIETIKPDELRRRIAQALVRQRRFRLMDERQTLVSEATSFDAGDDGWNYPVEIASFTAPSGYRWERCHIHVDVFFDVSGWKLGDTYWYTDDSESPPPWYILTGTRVRFRGGLGKPVFWRKAVDDGVTGDMTDDDDMQFNFPIRGVIKTAILGPWPTVVPVNSVELEPHFDFRIRWRWEIEGSDLKVKVGMYCKPEDSIDPIALDFSSSVDAEKKFTAVTSLQAMFY